MMARTFTAVFVGVWTVTLAAPVQWGSVRNGLRAGIRVSNDRNLPSIEVVIENLGTDTRNLDIPNGAADLTHNLRFRVIRDGKALDIFDGAVLKQPTPSFLQSGHMHLAPGEQRSLAVPIQRLIYIDRRRDMPLAQLIGKGYSVRAEFAGSGVTLTTPDIPFNP